VDGEESDVVGWLVQGNIRKRRFHLGMHLGLKINDRAYTLNYLGLLS
jgi:hypothetical protein